MKLSGLMSSLLIVSFGVACHSGSALEDRVSVAKIQLQGIAGINYQSARLKVKPAAGTELVFALKAPNLTMTETFAPGSYVFSLDLLGENDTDLMASSELLPCTPVSAELVSGSNDLLIPVCNNEGLVLQPVSPPPKAGMKIQVELLDRPLFYSYELSCSNTQASVSQVKAKGGQAVLTTWSDKPFFFKESQVIAGIHHLTAVKEQQKLQVSARLNANKTALESVEMKLIGGEVEMKPIQFEAHECTVQKIVAEPIIPGGFPTWDAINEADPEKFAAFFFDGIDPIAEVFGDDARCSVYIMASFKDEQGVDAYLMRTSFAHGGHSHPFIRIMIGQSLNLTGKSDRGQDEMRVTLKNAGEFLTLTSARTKWLHDDHFHSDTCERLIKRP